MSDFGSRTRRNLAPVFQGEDQQKDIVCDSTRHKSKRLFAISFPHTFKLMFHEELYLHESPWAQRTVTPWQCRSHCVTGKCHPCRRPPLPRKGRRSIPVDSTVNIQSTSVNIQSTYSQHTVNIITLSIKNLWFSLEKVSGSALPSSFYLNQWIVFW